MRMSEAFTSIKQGLIEAIEFAQGKTDAAVVHQFSAVDVKAIRQHVGMSQAEFASAFGISLGTLRHWERGDRTPRGAALVLLNIVAKEPQAVLRALSVTHP
jgi:putative transcriptional regulator